MTFRRFQFSLRYDFDKCFGGGEKGTITPFRNLYGRRFCRMQKILITRQNFQQSQTRVYCRAIQLRTNAVQRSPSDASSHDQCRRNTIRAASCAWWARHCSAEETGEGRRHLLPRPDQEAMQRVQRRRPPPAELRGNAAAPPRASRVGWSTSRSPGAAAKREVQGLEAPHPPSSPGAP